MVNKSTILICYNLTIYIAIIPYFFVIERILKMEFARLDYLQVGATDSQILTLIPSSGRQNLVIGDQTGVLSCM